MLLGCSDVAARMLCRCCASPAEPAVALHAHHVCCAGTDRKISYWDAYNGTAIRILEPNTSDILGWVAISSSGNWLVTGKPQLCEATAMSYSSWMKPLQGCYPKAEACGSLAEGFLPGCFCMHPCGTAHDLSARHRITVVKLTHMIRVMQETPLCACGTMMRAPVQLCWMAMVLKSKPSQSPQMTATLSQLMAVVACLCGLCQPCEGAELWGAGACNCYSRGHTLLLGG